MPRYSRSDLARVIDGTPLHVDTYSPGDGVTRYRFFDVGPADYFEGGSIYTALGMSEAVTFATGWVAGYNKASGN